ncbi:hypothetical protein LCI18_012502 [Fusarium solani-melongenae]|uniref:Uncharacterized protein n=1 Tax=Fusarium solani subsp. cucurbitae TaxID=2747967 RepID=A0ACD3ZK04_FUSSC|nr:hypothetical protein LCI18_012502 [Fusarium solani-melongenae]
MVSERTSRAQVARGLIKTEPSSIDESSFDETCSAPATSRRDHSGEYNGSSKFAEAMKNPDWRRRGEDRSSQQPDTSSAGNPHTQTDPHAPEHETLHGNEEICKYTCPWDHINPVNHWRSSHDYSETDVDDKDLASTVSHEMNLSSTETHETDTTDRGLCTLVHHMPLPGLFANGRPVSIIKVTPLFTGGGGLWHHSGAGSNPIASVAQIQRIRRECPKITEENNDDCGFDEPRAATTGEAPSRPRHYPERQSFESKKTTIDHSHKNRLERARNAVFHDPAVANIGSVYYQTQSNSNTGKQAAPLSKEAEKQGELELRHDAFQRMLQKLHRGTRQEEKITKEEPENASLRIHGCPWGQPLGQRQAKTRERQKANRSDSGIGSSNMEGSQRKESSRDSGVCMDPESLSRGLNPRAREFLSFPGAITMTTAQNQDDHKPSQKLTGDLLDMEGGKECGKRDDSIFSTLQAINRPYPLLPADYGADRMGGTSPPDFGTIPALNMSATGLGPLPGLPPFSFPLSTCQPLGLNATPGVASGTIHGFGLGLGAGGCPPPGGLTNQLNLGAISPAMQPFSVSPTPFVNNLSALPMPSAPLTTTGGVHSQPRPVPKPVNPNPGQQQAYEAWIEWRKATEPGYALECKNRQQRRAQRTSTVHMGPAQGPPKAVQVG